MDWTDFVDFYCEGVEPPHVNGFEDCVLGVFHNGEQQVAVVSIERILKKLAETHFKDTEDPIQEAIDWFDYNMDGAYLGPGTPVYVNEFNGKSDEND